MKSPYHELKEEAWRANMDIPKYRLALFTWGNASAFDAARGVFAIKPSGVPYDVLKAEDLVVLDLEGKVVEGTLRPSSDTPTHRVLYRDFPGVGGVVHTHSTYATAWAQSMRELPVYGTTHADFSPIAIPCTPVLSPQQVEGDYELETGNLIVQTFAKLDPSATTMVLVGGHAPFTWGKSAEKAVYNSVILEEMAKMAIMTNIAAGGPVPPLPQHVILKHHERKHGPKAYYGQS